MNPGLIEGDIIMGSIRLSIIGMGLVGDGGETVDHANLSEWVRCMRFPDEGFGWTSIAERFEGGEWWSIGLVGVGGTTGSGSLGIRRGKGSGIHGGRLVVYIVY